MSPQVTQALNDLNEHLADADGWMQALNEPQSPPTWVFPVSRLFERIQQQAATLEELLRREGPQP